MERRHNTQTISWFFDLYERERLDLDPPYQRKSVWTQPFKDYFIDTVLMNYPAPAIFLYEEIGADGRSTYHVVDGKQRLTTLFEFIRGDFSVSEQSKLEDHKGIFFANLPEEIRRAFWSYHFSVEYLPTSDDALISDVFDRINRNVSKLTPQELRHAKLDGEFISEAERFADTMPAAFGKNFPRLADQSRKQMKDVELVASLFLLLELGPQAFSQADLDKAFLERDEIWDAKDSVTERISFVFQYITNVLRDPRSGAQILASRLRNQVDFYSLVGALDELRANNELPSHADAAAKLSTFAERVDEEEARATDARLQEYYEAARSASSDRRSRETRIRIVKDVLLGRP